ncbi:MAG: DUF481 domain-containing protein, partial [Burkholderiales bacterium]
MFARVFIGTAVGAVVATSAVAQTASKPDGAWRGSTSLSATLAGGNTKSTNIGFNADAVRQTNIDKLGFYAQHLYGKNSGVTNAQQTRLGARYDRDLDDRLYAFGGLDLEKNKPADVKLRILPQVGLGYHVIKSEPTTFNIFGGLAYSDTNRYVATDTSGLEGMVGEESIHKISATTSFRQRLTVFQGFKSELGHRT